MFFFSLSLPDRYIYKSKHEYTLQLFSKTVFIVNIKTRRDVSYRRAVCKKSAKGQNLQTHQQRRSIHVSLWQDSTFFLGADRSGTWTLPFPIQTARPFLWIREHAFLARATLKTSINFFPQYMIVCLVLISFLSFTAFLGCLSNMLWFPSFHYKISSFQCFHWLLLLPLL